MALSRLPRLVRRQRSHTRRDFVQNVEPLLCIKEERQEALHCARGRTSTRMPQLSSPRHQTLLALK